MRNVGLTLADVQRRGVPREAFAARSIGEAMARGVDTRPMSERPPAEAPEVGASADVEQAVDEKPNTSPQESKIQRARNLLKRAGWLDGDFEKFSPAQILQRGSAAERSENRLAKLRAENAALRKQLEGKAPNDLQGNSSQGSQASTSGAGVAVPSVDVKSLARKLAQGDSELEAELNASLQAELSPVLGRLAELGQREQARLADGETEAASRLKEWQREVSEVYPDLANDDDLQEFLELHRTMSTTARYARWQRDPDVAEELVHAVARALGLQGAEERDDPAPERSVSGRGFMELKRGSSPTGTPKTAKEEFMSNVNAELRRRGYRAG